MAGASGDWRALRSNAPIMLHSGTGSSSGDRYWVSQGLLEYVEFMGISGQRQTIVTLRARYRAMIIIVSGCRAMFSFISVRDHKLMRRLNCWLPPRWVRAWMTMASRLGDGWLWWGIGFALLFFGGPNRFIALGVT